MTSSNETVRLIFFEQSIGCDSCAPTRRALRDIAERDPSVAVDTFNLVLDKEKAVEHGIDRVPAVIVSGPRGDRIRYYGAPLGLELPTLLQAIAMVRSGDTGLTPQSRERLAALSTPVRLQVFFTPSCAYCPQMISLANRAAVESPFVSAFAIDAAEFPDLVRRYHVNGVPKLVVNDAAEILGVVAEDDFIASIT